MHIHVYAYIFRGAIEGEILKHIPEALPNITKGGRRISANNSTGENFHGEVMGQHVKFVTSLSNAVGIYQKSQEWRKSIL